MYVLFLMCILWGEILPYVKKYVWLQVIVGIFVCLVFAAKICNTKLGLCLADVGKYSLQLYLLDGYFLGASRMLLVQLMACTSPVVIVVGNTVFDLVGAFLVIKYVLMKMKGVRVLCDER